MPRSDTHTLPQIWSHLAKSDGLHEINSASQLVLRPPAKAIEGYLKGMIPEGCTPKVLLVATCAKPENPVTLTIAGVEQPDHLTQVHATGGRNKT